MTVEQNHDAYDRGETQSWAWPVYAFVAWLAAMLGYVARFKRARRFKPDWRHSWPDLRHSEWLRDQLIAQGVAQLLAGQPLQLDDTKIQIIPPATYGGPCPCTPFDMNRRFIALARWAADPEAIIRERFKRLSHSLLAAHASTDAALCAAAQHELANVSQSLEALILSRPQSGRPSKHERGLTRVRGPPENPRLPTAHTLSPQRSRATESAPARRYKTPHVRPIPKTPITPP